MSKVPTKDDHPQIFERAVVEFCVILEMQCFNAWILKLYELNKDNIYRYLS